MNVRELHRSCKYGFTSGELRELIPDLDHFHHWMRGQTMMICSGERFNRDTKEYEPDCEQPHGPVVYFWDVENYLRGGQPLD